MRATFHRIVARHDGRIWADGRVGDGAIFDHDSRSPEGGDAMNKEFLLVEDNAKDETLTKRAFWRVLNEPPQMPSNS